MPQAVVLQRFGIGHLRLEGLEPEPLTAHGVRVAIDTVALNHRDVLVVRGRYGAAVTTPLVPCSDAAGTVVELGGDVDDLSVGQRVCTHMAPAWRVGPLRAEMRASTLGGPAAGVLCEQRVLPRDALVPVPDALSLEQAACLPVAGLTAWSALTGAAGIDRDSRVLLLGTGGVSLMGLQIAKALGARAAVVSASDEKLERVRALGADFTVNYRSEPQWAERVRQWSDGGVDAVLEVGGAATLDRSVRATREGGCVALIGILGRQDTPVDLSEVLMRRIRIEGIFVGSRVELERLLRFAAQHRLDPVIDRRFDALADARRAFAHLLEATHVGKVLIGAVG